MLYFPGCGMSCFRALFLQGFASAQGFATSKQSVKSRQSPPSRGRGSKPGRCRRAAAAGIVAPFTGAWIETAASCAPTACRSGRPLHGGADRNALLCPVNASFEGLKAIPHRLPNWIRRPRDLGGIILEFGAATRENPDPAVIARLRSYPDLKRTTPEACARSVWHLGESPPGKAVMLPWPDGTTREYPPRPASQSSDRRSLPAEVCARRFALRPWAHDPLPAGQTPAPIRSHRDQAICSLSIF